jgi:hypothetical protein
MTYQEPEVLEIGNAEEMIQILPGLPDMFEPSTQQFSAYDPQ